MIPVRTQLYNAAICVTAAITLALPPVLARALPETAMVRICSGTGVYYLPLEGDGQDRPTDNNGTHACHALCHGNKRQLKSRFFRRRRVT